MDPELDPEPYLDLLVIVRGTDPDLDPRKHVTDPQHWLSSILVNQLCFVGVQPRGLRGGDGPKAQPADEQGAPHPHPPPLGRSGSLLLPSPQEGEGQCLPMRCRLSLLTNSALVKRVQMRGKRGVAGSQPMSTAVHIT